MRRKCGLSFAEGFSLCVCWSASLMFSGAGVRLTGLWGKGERMVEKQGKTPTEAGGVSKDRARGFCMSHCNSEMCAAGLRGVCASVDFYVVAISGRG